MDDRELAELGGDVAERLNANVRAANGDRVWAKNMLHLIEMENGVGGGESCNGVMAMVWTMLHFLIAASAVGNTVGRIADDRMMAMRPTLENGDNDSFKALNDEFFAMISEIMGGAEVKKLARKAGASAGFEHHYA